MLQLLLLLFVFSFFVYVSGVRTILNNMNRSVDWWKWQINDVLLLFYNAFLMILWRKINCKHCKRYLMEWHRMHRSDTYLDASSTQKWCFKLVHNHFFSHLVSCRVPVGLVDFQIIFFSAIFFMRCFYGHFFNSITWYRAMQKSPPKNAHILARQLESER